MLTNSSERVANYILRQYRTEKVIERFQLLYLCNFSKLQCEHIYSTLSRGIGMPLVQLKAMQYVSDSTEIGKIARPSYTHRNIARLA